jgi:Uma2 family endonuclease
MTVGTLMTADELLRLPDDGWRYELVRGELQKMSPAGGRHGDVEMELYVSLGAFVKQHRLGRLYGADTGFKIAKDPDTVRCPDAAFVRTERVIRTPKFIERTPDAVFEVISPSDSYSEVEEKTRQWLRAGAAVVVIIDPETQTVRVHRTGSTTPVDDVLEIDDVIPGWRLPLSELFA